MYYISVNGIKEMYNPLHEAHEDSFVEVLNNNIEEKEPKIFNESENVEENISDEVEEKSSVPRSMFTESIFKSGDSKNETSLAGKNFSYSEPEFIEAEEEKKEAEV